MLKDKTVYKNYNRQEIILHLFVLHLFLPQLVFRLHYLPVSSSAFIFTWLYLHLPADSPASGGICFFFFCIIQYLVSRGSTVASTCCQVTNTRSCVWFNTGINLKKKKGSQVDPAWNWPHHPSNADWYIHIWPLAPYTPYTWTGKYKYGS